MSTDNSTSHMLFRGMSQIPTFDKYSSKFVCSGCTHVFSVKVKRWRSISFLLLARFLTGKHCRKSPPKNIIFPPNGKFRLPKARRKLALKSFIIQENLTSSIMFPEEKMSTTNSNSPILFRGKFPLPTSNQYSPKIAEYSAILANRTHAYFHAYFQ